MYCTKGPGLRQYLEHGSVRMRPGSEVRESLLPEADAVAAGIPLGIKDDAQ